MVDSRDEVIVLAGTNVRISRFCLIYSLETIAMKLRLFVQTFVAQQNSLVSSAHWISTEHLSYSCCTVQSSALAAFVYTCMHTVYINCFFADISFKHYDPFNWWTYSVHVKAFSIYFAMYMKSNLHPAWGFAACEFGHIVVKPMALWYTYITVTVQACR